MGRMLVKDYRELLNGYPLLVGLKKHKNKNKTKNKHNGRWIQTERMEGKGQEFSSPPSRWLSVLGGFRGEGEFSGAERLYVSLHVDKKAWGRQQILDEQTIYEDLKLPLFSTYQKNLCNF